MPSLTKCDTIAMRQRKFCVVLKYFKSVRKMIAICSAAVIALERRESAGNMSKKLEDFRPVRNSVDHRWMCDAVGPQVEMGEGHDAGADHSDSLCKEQEHKYAIDDTATLRIEHAD